MIKTIGAAALIASLLASTAMADSAGAPSEGKMNLKARLGYVANHTKVSGTNSLPSGSGLKNGFAGELAANYFVMSNVAIEGSIGYSKQKEKTTTTNSVATKGKSVTVVPLTALVQYHVMPEASVSPYVGLGYSYQIMSGGTSGLKYKNGGGIVGQLGADFAFNDTMGFNFDVKHTFKAKHDVKIGNTTTKTKLDSTTVMAGVTFPF